MVKSICYMALLLLLFHNTIATKTTSPESLHKTSQQQPPTRTVVVASHPIIENAPVSKNTVPKTNSQFASAAADLRQYIYSWRGLPAHELHRLSQKDWSALCWERVRDFILPLAKPPGCGFKMHHIKNMGPLSLEAVEFRFEGTRNVKIVAEWLSYNFGKNHEMKTTLEEIDKMFRDVENEMYQQVFYTIIGAPSGFHYPWQPSIAPNRVTWVSINMLMVSEIERLSKKLADLQANEGFTTLKSFTQASLLATMDIHGGKINAILEKTSLPLGLHRVNNKLSIEGKTDENNDIQELGTFLNYHKLNILKLEIITTELLHFLAAHYEHFQEFLEEIKCTELEYQGENQRPILKNAIAMEWYGIKKQWEKLQKDCNEEMNKYKFYENLLAAQWTYYVGPHMEDYISIVSSLYKSESIERSGPSNTHVNLAGILLESDSLEDVEKIVTNTLYPIVGLPDKVTKLFDLPNVGIANPHVFELGKLVQSLWALRIKKIHKLIVKQRKKRGTINHRIIYVQLKLEEMKREREILANHFESLAAESTNVLETKVALDSGHSSGGGGHQAGTSSHWVESNTQVNEQSHPSMYSSMGYLK